MGEYSADQHKLECDPAFNTRWTVRATRAIAGCTKPLYFTISRIVGMAEMYNMQSVQFSQSGK